MTELTIRLRRPHSKQRGFITSKAKRKVIRAGRRGGKTVGVAVLSVKEFLAGRRILYAAPTQEQIDAFWNECKRALQEPIDAGVFYINNTRHVIERAGTEQRIRAKTAWDADTLRGDYADLLILDEYQMMDPNAWRLVGAPMLLDNNGDAVFIYTTRRGAKGQHARELFRFAQAEQEKGSDRWAAFRFSSHDNPYLSSEALSDITQDMTDLAYRMEILADEIDDDPDALWKRERIERNRTGEYPDLARVVVGVDPPASHEGAECGIVVAGRARNKHYYVIDDRSLRGSPAAWGHAVVMAYTDNQADRVVGEVNNGGDMVGHTIRSSQGGQNVAYKSVRASRGKAIRAEPVAALYERGMVHHVGAFSDLEDQMCLWVPGQGDSPDRIDALVWAITELHGTSGGWVRGPA